jgi:uncharacterized protein YqgV (UPF0045/DUF77 family)
MLISVSVVTVGDSESQIDPVAEVVQRFADAGVDYEVNGMSTVVEGDWPGIMSVLGDAARNLRSRHNRVFWTITIDDHRDAAHRLHGSVVEVQQRLQPVAG